MSKACLSFGFNNWNKIGYKQCEFPVNVGTENEGVEIGECKSVTWKTLLKHLSDLESFLDFLKPSFSPQNLKLKRKRDILKVYLVQINTGSKFPEIPMCWCEFECSTCVWRCTMSLTSFERYKEVRWLISFTNDKVRVHRGCSHIQSHIVAEPVLGIGSLEP